ncbi:NINE protein [soil metagenome]
MNLAVDAPQGAVAPRAHRSKFIAGLLAFVLGGLGLHRLYLRTPLWWIYAAWLIAGMALYAAIGSRETTWIAVAALLPVWSGFAEAAAFAVMPDDRWDARFNRDSGVHSRNGWACVMLAIVVLLIGTTVMLTAIIVASQFYYEAQDISIDR